MLFSSSSLPSVTFPFSRNRVSQLTTSYSSLEISSIYNLSIRSRVRRCRSMLYSSKVKVIAMAELIENKESVNDRRSAEPVSSQGSLGHSLTFLDVRNEEELLSGIKKETEAGRLPSNVAAALEELYENYRSAVLQSGHPMAHEIIVSNMAVAFDRMLLEVEDPFVFSPHHKAVREPFDYYMFGQNYIRPLIDFRRSYVGNVSVFYDMEEKLRQGHNVVLISNHQSEADPAVISLLLEMTNPHIAENLTYVAGDRVVTDPLCKPFSMGRNLICVYSKKHMNDIPELAEMKRRSNTRSLKEMALLLRLTDITVIDVTIHIVRIMHVHHRRGGSQLIWIAPSGGRDRPDPSTGEWFPGQAPFDGSSVDNIRRLADHSSVPGHIYPLALMCHDIMPPPPQVEKEIGERREIAYHGVGLSVCPEISFNEVAAGHEDPEEAKEAYSQALFSSVTEQYNLLKAAINGNQGLKASTSAITLSQPWQ